MPALGPPYTQPPAMSALVRGRASNYTVQLVNKVSGNNAVNVYTTATTLTCSVISGDDTAPIATPTVVWLNGATGAAAGQVQVQFVASDTATAVPGTYILEVVGTTSGSPESLSRFQLPILDAAGTSVGNPVDLVSMAQVQAALAQVLPADESFIATAITAASRAAIRFCGDRYFVRKTYTEEYRPALEGVVSLRQIPVNAVLKVEGTRDIALTLDFSSANGQSAWVAFSYTGQTADETLAYTGLTLSSVTNGVETDTTLLFATYPTLGALATAIKAVAGWSANTGGVYALWPSTALITADTAQGAMTANGCELEVYSEVLTVCRLDKRTGMLATTQRNLGRTSGPQWGPDWQVFEEGDTPASGTVRVTYDAGFNVVPEDVQTAVVLLIKVALQETQTDTRYSDWTADKVAGTLAALDERVFPESVKKLLMPYVLHRLD